MTRLRPAPQAGRPLLLTLTLAAAAFQAPAQGPPRPAASMVRTWGRSRLLAHRLPALGPGRVRTPLQARNTQTAATAVPPARPSRPPARRAFEPAPWVAIVVTPTVPSLRACASCGLAVAQPPGHRSPWQWTVAEPGGGTLTRAESGELRYTAPFVSRPRRFHVIAASPLDPSFAGRAAIEVRPNPLLAVLEPAAKAQAGTVPGLELSAGTAPEAGRALAARSARPHGLTCLPGTRQWLVSYPGNRGLCREAAGSTLQDPDERVDFRDSAQGDPLACPTHLAANGADGVDWRCVIAETDLDRIRIADARGVVVPLAGEPGGHRLRPRDKHRDGPCGQARFWAPEGVALDRDGTVYVADVGNGALRRIQDGVVSTLQEVPHARARNRWGDHAEAPNLELAGPLNGGLALDPEAGVLYAGVGHSVLRIELKGDRAGEARTLLGDAGQAGFEAWRADPPLAMAGVPCLSSPCNLAWFRGRLVIADHGNHAVRVYDPATDQLRTLAGDPGQAATRPGPLRAGSPHLPPSACAALAYPMGIAFDPDGGCRVATRDGVVSLSGLATLEPWTSTP